jgi:hypothetical protein
MRTTALAACAAAMLVSGCSLLAFDDLSSRYDSPESMQNGGGRAQDTDKTDPGTLESSGGPVGESSTMDGGGGGGGKTTDGGGADGAPKTDAGTDAGNKPKELPPPQTGTCTSVESADDGYQYVSGTQVICGQLSTATDVDMFAMPFGGSGGRGSAVVKITTGSGSTNIVFKREYSVDPDTATTLAPGQVGSIDTTQAATAKVEIRATGATGYPLRYSVEFTQQKY